MLKNHLLTLLGLVALSTSPLSATSYTFATINAPQGTSIVANAINNSGEIVGSIRPNGAPFMEQQAFLYQNGAFQSIDSADSAAMGINNLGQIIGWDTKGTFLYSGGQLTSLPSSIGQPFSINDKDQIVAYSAALNWALGIIDLNTGAVKQIANPYYPTATSNPSALNNVGEVTGIMPAIPNRAFLYQNGTYTVLMPSNDPNSWADPTGINNEGEVAGTYLDTSNATPYSEGSEQGFIYSDGSYQYVAVPNSLATTIADINDNGQIIGTYLGSDNVWRTFLGTPTGDPTPEPSSLALLGGGLFSMVLLGSRRLKLHLADKG